MTFNINGIQVNHVENRQDVGVPWVGNNAVLLAGSRDNFGWAIGGDGVDSGFFLYFSRPFVGQSVCTLTGAGQALIWYASDQTPSYVAFRCAEWYGQPCGPSQWVEYHCFGQGG
jgi:hypothetical protein